MVVIPDGPIDFPSSATRHRRDHVKFLSMVTALATLHQHQRERRALILDGVEVSYVQATIEDVEYASELCRRVLVRDVDGLAPQAQRLLLEVRAVITEEAQHFEMAIYDVEFTRRQLRERLGWSINQVRDTTDRLVELEYLVVSGGGRGRCRSYRLVADVDVTVPTPARPVGEGGEVGDDVPPTGQRSPSGGTDELVPLGPKSHNRRDADTSTGMRRTARLRIVRRH